MQPKTSIFTKVGVVLDYLWKRCTARPKIFPCAEWDTCTGRISNFRNQGSQFFAHNQGNEIFSIFDNTKLTTVTLEKMTSSSKHQSMLALDVSSDHSTSHTTNFGRKIDGSLQNGSVPKSPRPSHDHPVTLARSLHRMKRRLLLNAVMQESSTDHNFDAMSTRTESQSSFDSNMSSGGISNYDSSS